MDDLAVRYMDRRDDLRGAQLIDGEVRSGQVLLELPSFQQPQEKAGVPDPQATGEIAVTQPDESAAINRRTEEGATDSPRLEGQLDIVTLASAYADALANVEIAEANLIPLEHRTERNALSQDEAARARLDLRRIELNKAKRKLNVLRKLLELAIASAENEVAELKRLHESKPERSGASTVRLRNTERNLEMLRAILE